MGELPESIRIAEGGVDFDDDDDDDFANGDSDEEETKQAAVDVDGI